MTYWAWLLIGFVVLVSAFLACRLYVEWDQVQALARYRRECYEARMVEAVGEKLAADELAHQVRVGEGWGLV